MRRESESPYHRITSRFSHSHPYKVALSGMPVSERRASDTKLRGIDSDF